MASGAAAAAAEAAALCPAEAEPAAQRDLGSRLRLIIDARRKAAAMQLAQRQQRREAAAQRRAAATALAEVAEIATAGYRHQRFRGWLEQQDRLAGEAAAEREAQRAKRAGAREAARHKRWRARDERTRAEARRLAGVIARDLVAAAEGVPLPPDEPVVVAQRREYRVSEATGPHRVAAALRDELHRDGLDNFTVCLVTRRETAWLSGAHWNAPLAWLDSGPSARHFEYDGVCIHFEYAFAA
eukprot:TRINITY_DN6036_c0_g2_i2.p2 TRINITY_DN6036_c0_g2~~TRINITY_DN6036_c0_g2_i2.p2  ORF type:complete len:270 (+),score=84.57 TRINITY_DN6036_c0_g2_i2:85-810(+)